MAEPTDRSLETVSISEFKARCLALLEQVRRTRRPLLVTRRGEPVAEVGPPPPTSGPWLGSAASTGRIVGDIVAPILGPADWEAIGS